MSGEGKVKARQQHLQFELGAPASVCGPGNQFQKQQLSKDTTEYESAALHAEPVLSHHP